MRIIGFLAALFLVTAGGGAITSGNLTGGRRSGSVTGAPARATGVVFVALGSYLAFLSLRGRDQNKGH